MAEIIRARPSEPTMRLPAASHPLALTPRERIQDSRAERGTGEGTACPLWDKTIKLQCGQPEAVKIRSRSVADATLADIAAPPVTVTQGGSAGDHAHRFHLVLVLEGQGTYYWAGGAVTQAPGDIVLLDTAEPSRLVSPVSARLLRWSFPEAFIAPFLPARDISAVLHLPAREGLMTVLARHACELAREADRLDHSVQHGLLAHLCGLLGLAIEAEKTRRSARRRNYRAYQRQRILAYIERHLDDCRLTAGRVAKDLGMSPRWLHALLENVAEGFPDLVARRRLEKSLRLLHDQASDHLSIAEIAFLSGFNDLSTFYRRFGEHYNTTPGEARRIRQQAA